MSHQPERKEKNCLNCGTQVQGRYCHICGQENIETKESFFLLLRHFIYDIFHFDHQFFDTLRYLLFRPGFLSRQYVAGKRASYLNPIRMYLFTSALFFLVIFSIKDPKNGFLKTNLPKDVVSQAERNEAIDDIKAELAKEPNDTALLKKLTRLQDTTIALKAEDVALDNNGSFIGFKDSSIKSLQQYDSLQNSLPAGKKDGWLKKMFIRKGLAINSKYNENPNEGIRDFLELFLHKLPYLLFLSLPFFALILKLLYIRRKEFYYSDHAIFTLHHYIFSFILLLLIFLTNLVLDWTKVHFFQYIINAMLLSWPVYLYAAMKNFYRQSRGKTFSKFLLLNALGIIVLLLLFIVFLFFTIFQL